ncbi:hypothetical protein [Bradyrhizobium sp. Ec3.3]|uniref:hypothetical protein n=1 Tax=Bradyrhizobium sp. Ec3.3 TaxID=189753 RepID=UPI0004037FF7|nr:hypothetical protein [Bradyrhizobium sp. Ec3.3]
MSRFVDFLSQYGPSAATDALVDEHAPVLVEEFGVSRPIEIAPPRLQDIRDALLGADPRTVILTGTAGDGKTFHLRKFFVDLVENSAAATAAWGEAADRDGIIEWDLPSGRRLRIIRDVSALPAEMKLTQVRAAAAAIRSAQPETVFLMAANDGQLLDSFAAAASDGTETAALCLEIYREMIEMMRSGREHPRPTFAFSMFNLSRTLGEESLDALLDAVLDHPDWENGCASCPRAVDTTNPCPIRCNRSLLVGANGSTAFRARIKTLVRLAAANDQHIPIRYLLMLIVNVLLGFSQKPSRPLLNCAVILKAKTPLYKYTNPYDNACGANIRDPEKRRKNPFFALVSSLGIGAETDNEIDALLLARDESNPVRISLFENDRIYGDRIFNGPLDHYAKRGSDRNNGHEADELRAALQAQRRRLFFKLGDQGSPSSGLSPWRLTVFRHAGEYEQLCAALKAGQASGDALRQIVLGINRTLTGLMASDGEKLWVTGVVGRADGNGGRLAMGEPLGVVPSSWARVQLQYDANRSCPALAVLEKGTSRELPRLIITPLLFEYLKRVSSGSLPSSFSRQCHQEIRHFAVRLASALYDEEDQETTVIRMVDLDNSGRLHEHILEIGK